MRANLGGPKAKTGKLNGGPLAEGPWQWDQATMGSRHNHLLGLVRAWREEPDPDKLVAKAWKYIERHGIPLGRGPGEDPIDDAELREMAVGAVEKFDDDRPAAEAVEGNGVEDWVECRMLVAITECWATSRGRGPVHGGGPHRCDGHAAGNVRVGLWAQPGAVSGLMQRTNLTVLLVGGTGFGGRKGTSLDVCRSVFRFTYPDLDRLWLVGVASGEAIAGHYTRLEAAGKQEPRPAGRDGVRAVADHHGSTRQHALPRAS